MELLNELENTSSKTFTFFRNIINENTIEKNRL